MLLLSHWPVLFLTDATGAIIILIQSNSKSSASPIQRCMQQYAPCLNMCSDYCLCDELKGEVNKKVTK